MDNPIASSSNAEVANKCVRTSETFVQTRKSDLVVSIEESTLSTSTDCNEVTHTSGSTEQGQCYRLKAGSRLKFQGKSPSKLEFQLIKSANHKTAHKRSSKKSILFHPQPSQCTCNKVKGGIVGGGDASVILNMPEAYERPSSPRGLSSSFAQRVKLLFDKQKTDPTPEQYKELETQISQHQSIHEQKENNVILYHFEHGCPEYYRTFDCPPHLISDMIAQQTAFHATRFWAEIFGFINVGVTFFVTFFLQFFRFLLYATFKIFIMGILQITSDYLLKPLLSVIFNGFLQPPLTFIQNIFISFTDVLYPVAKCLGNFLSPFTEIVRALRLVEVNQLESSNQNQRLKNELNQKYPIIDSQV